MNLRWRIIALPLAALAVVLAMGVVMALALRSADHFVERVESGQRRFEVIAELVGHANNYGEQLASVLLFGREQLSAVDDARIAMERAFARLTLVTRADVATLGPEEMRDGLLEIENARRMVELYHSIDLAAARVLVMQREERDADARELFRRDVEFRLVNELAPLLQTALEGERREIADRAADARRIQDWSRVAGGTTAGLGLLLLAGLGYLLHRDVTRLSRSAARGPSPADGAHPAESRRAQFLADVSHELRTPLTVLRGEADVALRGSGDPAEQRQALERIQGQAVELSQLLDELITFARSDAENQPYVTTETRLDEVIAAAAQEAEVLAEPREVGIAVTLGDRGSRIEADFRRLRQALIIGLDNAVKHSPPGGRIGIETARDTDRAIVRILDEGPGVAEADRPFVFDRFFRARSESELQNPGLGIGLAIAKEIVERHGGSIALDNRPAGGAVLEIRLPLVGGGMA